MLDTDTAIGAGADRRLREEEIVWLATVRSDGQPQPVPVWFLWDGKTFLIYTEPERQKLRNISKNPRVSLHLNSDERGDSIVRADGMAWTDEEAPPADEVGAYLEKYRNGITRIGFDPEGFSRAYSVAIRVSPERWRMW